MQKIIITICAVFVLSGCKAFDPILAYLKEPPREIPQATAFRFDVRSFKDARVEKAEEFYALNQQELAAILATTVNSNLHANLTAKLDVQVTNYKTYVSGLKHHVELGFHLKGTRNKGAVLADTNYKCVSSGTQPFELDEMLRRRLDGVKFTERQRKAKIWLRLIQECVDDVVNEFNNDVLSAKGV